MINCKLHLFTAVIHCFSKLLVTPHVLSIHPANSHLHRLHHYNTLPSNLQRLNPFRILSRRETLLPTLGLNEFLTQCFVASCRLHRISILTTLMHGPYHYTCLVHVCKVLAKSVIVKVVLRIGHYVDINRNVSSTLLCLCF